MSAPSTSTTSGAPLPALEFTYTTWEKQGRRVLVGVDATDHTGVWSVFDVPVGRGHAVGWLVARLDGYDEKLDAACALAADYASEQQRFHDEERSEHALADPLPRPVDVQLAEIRKHTALARRLAAPAEPASKPVKTKPARVVSSPAPTALAA